MQCWNMDGGGTGESGVGTQTLELGIQGKMRGGAAGAGTAPMPLARAMIFLSGRGVWHEAMVLVCLPLAAPIGLSPLYISNLCGSERVLVVSTEPLDDLSCLTIAGSAVPETGCCPCR